MRMQWPRTSLGRREQDGTDLVLAGEAAVSGARKLLSLAESHWREISRPLIRLRGRCIVVHEPMRRCSSVR